MRPSLYAQTVFSEHGPLGLPNGAGDGQHVLADAPVAYKRGRRRGRGGAGAGVRRRLQKCEDAGPHGASRRRRFQKWYKGGRPCKTLYVDAAGGLFEGPRHTTRTVSHDTERALGEEPTAASDFFERELRRRALDCGKNGAIAYNGRAVYTANYRSSLPFDEVRRKSRGLGLRCREDYEELGVPKYAPSRPEDMFPDRWLGWDDYLGVRRPYDEGRRVAQTLGPKLRWYTYAFG